jgi:hypothetical protein
MAVRLQNNLAGVAPRSGDQEQGDDRQNENLDAKEAVHEQLPWMKKDADTKGVARGLRSLYRTIQPSPFAERRDGQRPMEMPGSTSEPGSLP